MELIWNEVSVERLISSVSEQVSITGELPSPDGRIPQQISFCAARVAIDNALIDAEEVRLEGRVNVTLTAIDGENRAFSYESSAGFTHRIRIEGLAAGMSVEAKPVILSLSCAPSREGAALNANIDLNLRVTSAIPLKVTDGIKGIGDLEIKRREIKQTIRKKLGTDTLRMREELAAENVAEVISCEGQLLVRDVSTDGASAVISGTITVSAVTADPSGHLGQLIRQVPFREKIGLDALGDNAYCVASLDSLYARSLGEEFGIIAMEAEVTFTVYALNEIRFTVPADAFSPTVGFDCLYDEVEMIDSRGGVFTQNSIKESLTLPEGYPDISSPLFAAARCVITETEASESGIIARGVITSTVAYESVSGRIAEFTEDVPFEAMLDCESGVNSPVISASCIASIVSTEARSMQMQYSLIINSELYRVEKLSLVTGLAEKEKPAPFSGIIIGFASEGDCAFDIAKRYSVPCECVKKLNGDIKEPFSEGKKLILFV